MHRPACLLSILVVLAAASAASAQSTPNPNAVPPDILKDEAFSRAAVPKMPGLPPAAEAAMRAIDPERMRAHVKFLASDLLEGRGTGARGGDIAGEYMATQFELYGLKPAGDDGTYYQKVPLVGITTEPQTTFELVPANGAPMVLRQNDDYVVTDESGQTTDDVDLPIVFAGYGIRAPEYKWDDYKNADVKGKILLMLVNEPPSDDPKFFNGKALTYYGRWTYKYEEAARMGAAGVILIHKTDMASYPWEVVRNSWGGEKSYLRDEVPRLHVAAWVQLEVARKLAQMGGQDLDKLMEEAKSRDFHPVPLTASLKAHLVSKVRNFASSNIVAILPGSDPKLKSQAVMYTAHYDHLGIGPTVNGDNIYHGASDNATGCAILLELARVLAASPVRPRRSIVFASVTAEEQGLLGSEYLGKHSPVAPADVTLDLNYDDIPPRGFPEEVEAIGAERTTFYPTFEAVAKDFHLAIVPDDNPNAGHYYRSDHFSLAHVGIPAFSISEGLKYKGHTRDWGQEQSREFVAKHYHQPSDKYLPDMDFTGDAVLARFGLALGWKAASEPKLVMWKPGDEFEAARSEQSTAVK